MATPSSCLVGTQVGAFNCTVHCQGAVEVVQLHLPVASFLHLSLDAATGGMQNFSWWCAVDGVDEIGDWRFESDVAQFVKDIHATYVNVSKT
jgi:hypothetical protein